jgi:hypothetical protein
VNPTAAQRLATLMPPFSTLDELMEAAGTRYADKEALGIKKVCATFVASFTIYV